jgi:hypothetical protein
LCNFGCNFGANAPQPDAAMRIDGHMQGSMARASLVDKRKDCLYRWLADWSEHGFQGTKAVGAPGLPLAAATFSM